MNFSNDLIKKMFLDAKQIFNFRKIMLLECSSKIVVSSSCFDVDEKLLLDLKEVLDRINYCLSYCDEYLDKINNELDFSSNLESSISSLFDSISLIDKFLNTLLIDTKLVFNTQSSSLENVCAEKKAGEIDDVSTSTETENSDTSNSEVAENTDFLDNNILLISEKSKKVFLPYKISDLQSQLDKSKKYKDIQTLIDQKYILPIDQFNNAIVSRFKQTYNLCRDKSAKSISSSIELAFELAFNYSLNPAIIAACKNIDELDIYLACLEENELDKFDLFEIKYEILPK